MNAEAAKGLEQQGDSLWADVTTYHDAFMSQFRKMVEDLKMKEAVEELLRHPAIAVNQVNNEGMSQNLENKKYWKCKETFLFWFFGF